MEETKKWLKKNYVPRISFNDGVPHIITILKEKEEEFTDKKGEQVNGIKYLVKEDGIAKSVFTTSFALLQRLAEVPLGSKVKVLQKRISVNGNPQTTYQAWLIDGDTEEEIIPDESNDDIPTIEEGEEPIQDENDEEIPF